MVQGKVYLLNTKLGQAPEVLATIMQMVLINGCTTYNFFAVDLEANHISAFWRIANVFFNFLIGSAV